MASEVMESFSFFLGLMLCIRPLVRGKFVCHFEDEKSRDRSPRVQEVWVLVVFKLFRRPLLPAVFSLCWENFEELSVAIGSICSR